ncbi:hypothetical protein [Novosphingobium lentum]|uniref:hypothetical protein n=1 Tax=Novosphingobium lentum TaxID=145287 RepID=UPI00082E6E47|nr:hypothetical protein [Novosphingobium lentum]
MRYVSALAAFALTSAGWSASANAATAPQTAAPDLSRLTEGHTADLRCAAAFAIVASEQQRGVQDALAYAPLGYRGKEYFVRVSARVEDEAGLSKEAVRDILVRNVAEMQQQAAAIGDPATELSNVVKPCLARLDKEVAPLVRPDLLQCSAILQVAYEQLHASEGLTPAAQDLRTLASVLTAREHEALVAGGKSGEEADRALGQAHDALLAEAFAQTDKAGGDGGAIEKYDIAHCYDLARPDPKSHY